MLLERRFKLMGGFCTFSAEAGKSERVFRMFWNSMFHRKENKVRRV